MECVNVKVRYSGGGETNIGKTLNGDRSKPVFRRDINFKGNSVSELS